jgi:nicotinate phosphoribosyltransferase
MATDRPRSREIMTDLYELTMAASYFEQDMFAPATFSLMVRHDPSKRSYLVCAGLDPFVGSGTTFRDGQCIISLTERGKGFKIL